MARLVLFFNNLENAHRANIRERKNLRRIARYSQNAFSMSSGEFVSNYRLSKEMFQELCGILEPHMAKPKRRSDISIQFKILVTLSFYATGSYQRLVGGMHGTLMSQQSVSRAIKEVTDALNVEQVIEKFIVFPQNQQQRNQIKRRFYEKFGVPGVIGCIDGTHVAMVRPTQNEERYFNNRKHCHSRNVQIICDADQNIISVDASFGGATHDSFIWNQHPIRSHLINLIDQGETVRLLGDSGYAQREYMMTPIIDAAEGSPEEYYTTVHCSARNTVERTIGLLKSRWRCLLKHRVLHYKPDVVGKIINACCVLHNFCNVHNIQQQLDIASIESQENYTILTASTTVAVQDLQRGIQARHDLVNQLWNARHRRI